MSLELDIAQLPRGKARRASYDGHIPAGILQVISYLFYDPSITDKIFVVFLGQQTPQHSALGDNAILLGREKSN